MGFDRFYGFLGGETNQWYPDLVEDNRFIEQPYGPEDGYHLSKDLADKAIGMIRDQKASNPSKPWYMWFCPGANHAPHHAPQDYIDKYKGKFDDGYEAYREWVLPRMIAKGIIPEGTQLTPLNPLPPEVADPADAVRPWNTLNADEKKLFARLMEVYAGFSEYTDAQVGRIIDYLEQTGQLENTIVLYAADNGASGEGSPNGSVNENKFFNGYPDELSENLKYLDVLGSTGHVRALPDRLGDGLLDALQDVQALRRVLRRHLRSAGDLLAQGHQGQGRGAAPVSPFHRHRAHAPRALRPRDAHGLQRRRAVSALRCLDALHASTRRRTRRPGRSASTTPCSARAASGRTDGRPSRSMRRSSARGTSTRTCGSCTTSTRIAPNRRNLAAEHPEKLEALIKAWFEEAEKNFVLPLDDRSAVELLSIERPTEEAPRERYIYYPDTSPVPEGVAVERAGTLVQDPRRRRDHRCRTARA